MFVTTCGSVFDVRAIIFFFGRLNPFSYLSRLLLHGGWFPLPLPQKFHSLRYIILQTDLSDQLGCSSNSIYHCSAHIASYLFSKQEPNNRFLDVYSASWHLCNGNAISDETSTLPTQGWVSNFASGISDSF